MFYWSDWDLIEWTQFSRNGWHPQKWHKYSLSQKEENYIKGLLIELQLTSTSHRTTTSNQQQLSWYNSQSRIFDMLSESLFCFSNFLKLFFCMDIVQKVISKLIFPRRKELGLLYRNREDDDSTQHINQPTQVSVHIVHLDERLVLKCYFV